MNLKQLSTVDYLSFEYDVLRVSTKSGYTRLVVVHRPPATSQDIFIAMDKPTDKQSEQIHGFIADFCPQTACSRFCSHR